MAAPAPICRSTWDSEELMLIGTAWWMLVWLSPPVGVIEMICGVPLITADAEFANIAFTVCAFVLVVVVVDGADDCWFVDCCELVVPPPDVVLSEFMSDDSDEALPLADRFIVVFETSNEG